jgi:signal transduction histidine kinase
VSDRGLGIPVSEQPRIFEQFYRARHTDVHNVKGAGMGLALVKRIMENHGGRVTVESRPGEGSKFRLVFPPARINHRDPEAQRMKISRE